MGELLGALGLAWPRLLLYPGGLFALCASWLLARWLAWCAGRPAPPFSRPALVDIIDVVPPLAVLALLPLTPAARFPYGIDLLVALGLLEWPALRATMGHAPERNELARAYGPLVLAALAMAEGAGGMGLTGLLRWPTAWPLQALLLGGAGLWLWALPRVLAKPPHGFAWRLRALGLLLVGSLPLVGALAASANSLPVALADWLIPPMVYLSLAFVLGGALRVRRSRG